MANFFTVDILTPYKVVAKGIPAESLLLQTVKGQINVLPKHTHLVTKLVTGQLTVFGGPDDPDRNFSVSYGTCKVLDNKITILAHTSEEEKDINADRAKLALKNAEDKLANSSNLSDDEIEKYRRKMERARLRIQMSEFVRSRKI